MAQVNAPDQYQVPVLDDDAGGRLDSTLARALPELSRTRLKALIQAGEVSQGGEKLTDPSARVKPGDTIIVMVPPVEPARPQGQNIPLSVVFEDEDLIVIDKPPGLVVHPAAGNPDGTLVNALIEHCGGSLSGIGGEARPGIVHRLDKDTSGLIVAAKNDLAHQGLARQFSAHSLERAYKAVVWGVPIKKEDIIHGNIGRDRRNRKRMAVVSRGGKEAETGYRRLERFGDTASLIECRLTTGRTHQIRVHLTSIGHPVIGDPQYGGRRNRRTINQENGVSRALAELNRQALHAYLLGFEHPISGEWVRFESDLPCDINQLIKILTIR